MKKIFTFILALVAGAGTLFAETIASGTCGADGDNLTWDLTDSVLTISGTGNMKSYTTYVTHPAPWNKQRESIRTVVINEGVTSIGYYAFWKCTSMTSVSIPTSDTAIAEGAFNGCSALPIVEIPSSVTSFHRLAFEGCTALTAINFDSENTKYCSIDGVVFTKDTTTLVVCPGGRQGAYSIPNTVTRINSYAFNKCLSLTSVEIPNSVTKIGGYAFKGCTNIASIEIPEGFTSFSETSAFKDFPGLKSITLPSTLTNLGTSTFVKCTGLVSIEIPEGITSIGDNVFDGCTSMSSVTIPNTVTQIGKHVFDDCIKLHSIEIPESVKSIGNYAFQNCSTLTSIVIPDSVTVIGEYLLYRCAALSSVTMSDSVTSIGQSAFSGCKKLASINIPKTVKTIGKNAFSGCTALTSIELPQGLKAINESTFHGCTALISIDIPNSVTYIYKSAFALSTGLTSVTIGTGVTGLAESAFDGCTGLTSITCKAVTPPSVSAFFCFNSVDKSIPVYVPEASLPAYKTSYWAQFSNILPLTSRIFVTIPTDVPNGYYENMVLEQHKLNTQFVEKRSVLNKREFLFGSAQGSKYLFFLKNAYGQIMGRTDTVELGEEDIRLKIEELLRTKDVSLKVTTPDEKDLTDKVSILWADSTNNAIGHTAFLKAVAEGAKLTCKVTLPDELALQYIAPEAIQHTVDPEAENLLTLTLQPIQPMTLHGLVKDSESGAVISDASVVLTQQLGGNDRQSVIATTDKDGKYELQGTNVQGVLSVTAPGYLPKTLEFNAPNAEGALPLVEMDLFTGVIVSVWLTYTEAVPEGEESKVTEGYEGNGDIAYEVYNQTKDAAVGNVIVKDNMLYFPSDVEIGDKLQVTVSSQSNDFSPVSAVCKITKSTMGSVKLALVQRGCLKAAVPADKSDSVMAILYNADGRFVRHSPYSFDGISLAGLTAGDYSLVTMTSNPLLRNVLLQSTFEDMGLVDGTDYVKNAVHIEDGKIVSVNIENVPALDMEKLRFTDARTYFIADKSVVNIGQYNTISGRANFREQYAGRITDVEYVVDVPEEIEVLAGYALCNEDVCNYRFEDGHYIFPVEAAEEYEEYYLTCDMKPAQQGDFRITGSVRFKLDGVQTLQPIGSAWLKVNGFAMNTPMFHTSSTLCVSGTAPTYCNGYTVEIYDYDKLIGTTTVMASGKWAANIQLPSNGKYDVHAVKARMTMPEVGVVESEVKNVAYNSSAKMAKKVVMINQKKESITFNYFDKPAKNIFYGYVLEKTWYEFWHMKTPYTTEFTFLAYFDEADLSEGGDVKISVLASDGTTRTMDAAYDGKQHCYYATTDYPHYTKIPVSAYAFTQATYAPISEEDQDAMWEEKEQALAKLTQATLHAVETTGELEILPGDDETLNMKYSVAEKDSFLISMKEMDYDEASAYAFENGPLIYSGEEGNIVYTFVEGENESVMVLLDVDEHYALRMVINFDGTNEQEANAGKRYVGPNNINAAGAWSGLMGAGSGLLTALGLWDWINGIPEAYEFNVRRAKHTEDINNHIIIFNWILNWKCDCGKDPDKPRFSLQDRITYTEREVALLEQNEAFMQRLQAYSNQTVEATCKKMVADIISMLAGAGAGKAIAKGAATKLGPGALAKLQKAAALIESDGGKVTTSTLGFVKDLLKSGLLGNQSFDQWIGADFRSLLKQMMAMIDGEGQAIINGFDALEKDMAVDNDNCFEEEECEGDDCDPEECEGGDCIPEDECEGEDCEDECEGDDCDPGDECEGDDCDPGECEGDDCDPEECEGEDCDPEECEGEDCEDDCEGEDCKKKEPKDDKFPPGYPFPDPACVHIDPSGFIYEAVLSNRVEGATVTLYYAVSEGQDAMWDADNYGQINPQITGADGKYQWDVPEGSWQVRVQKEGYQTAITDWLPVPPPQLDVNIPLVRNKQPEVEKAHAYEDAVTVKFDSYMKPAGLTTEMITVKENGNAVEGTITLTNEEAAPGGATYASQIRFVPTTPFTANAVTLLISGEVKNYADIEMGEPYEAVLPIEKELKALKADKTVKVEYGSTGVLHVKGIPAVAAAGKTVTVQCESGIFASTTQTTVVLNEKGEADVTIQGDLPGTEYVTFTLTETEQTAITQVKVVTHLEVLEAPTASIPTGTEVEIATPVTLSCQMEGAKIYYTLDGSNPRNSGTRILYDGTPIVIFEETTLKAVAFYDGKGQSEITTCHYTIKTETRITAVSSADMKVTPAHVRDAFEVVGVDGAFRVSLYSVTGKLLMKRNNVHSGEKITVTALPTGVYLVVVNADNAYFTQQIVKE